MLTPAKADIYTLGPVERFGEMHRSDRELTDEKDPCYIQKQENIAMWLKKSINWRYKCRSCQVHTKIKFEPIFLA